MANAKDNPLSNSAPESPRSPSKTWIAVGTTGADISTDAGAHWSSLNHENANAILTLSNNRALTAGPKATITQLNLP